ncbi:MAG: type II toxin-antitoxin system VapC family toxin [Candidatus Binatia bacterium]
MKRVLLDTGVLVALANKRDPDHGLCQAAWKPLRARPVTVEGVLVEAAYLLRGDARGARAAVDIAITAGTEFRPITPGRLGRALDLMDRYRNVPMDLVDALLTAVAEEEEILDIFTLDQRGFGTYRLRGAGAFRILPVAPR